MLTSTRLIPSPSIAQATPPMAVWPTVRLPSGRSMRLPVSTGASVAQPRTVQYAGSCAYVEALMRVTHFVAEMKP